MASPVERGGGRANPGAAQAGYGGRGGGPYYGGCGGGQGDGNPVGGPGHGHGYYQGQGSGDGAGGGGRGCGYDQGDGGGRGYYQGGGDGRRYYQGGRKSVYIVGELPFNTKVFEVTLPDNKPGPSGQRKERKFKVTIKQATLVSLQQVQMLMAGIFANIPTQALHVLDIVLHDIVLNEWNNMGFIPVGRSFFSRAIKEPIKLGQGIEGWNEFYQSIRPTQSRLSINIDMSSTAFARAVSLIDFIREVLNRRDLIHAWH